MNSAIVTIEFETRADAERFYFSNPGAVLCNGTRCHHEVEGNTEKAQELVRAADTARNAKVLECETYNA